MTQQANGRYILDDLLENCLTERTNTSLDILRQHLCQPASMPYRGNSNKLFYLGLAVESGWLELVNVLLSANASPWGFIHTSPWNQRYWGKTIFIGHYTSQRLLSALIMAAGHGYDDIVRLLLGSSWRCAAYTRHRRYYCVDWPMAYAESKRQFALAMSYAVSEHQPTLAMANDVSERQFALAMACRHGHIKVVRTLLSTGLNINTSCNYSFLYYDHYGAACRGHALSDALVNKKFEVVELLMAESARRGKRLKISHGCVGHAYSLFKELAQPTNHTFTPVYHRLMALATAKELGSWQLHDCLRQDDVGTLLSLLQRGVYSRHNLNTLSLSHGQCRRVLMSQHVPTNVTRRGRGFMTRAVNYLDEYSRIMVRYWGATDVYAVAHTRTILTLILMGVRVDDTTVAWANAGIGHAHARVRALCQLLLDVATFDGPRLRVHDLLSTTTMYVAVHAHMYSSQLHCQHVPQELLDRIKMPAHSMLTCQYQNFVRARVEEHMPALVNEFF